MPKPFFVLLMVAIITWAQEPNKARPDFKDFPAQRIYHGAPRPPKITKDWRMYRTMIRRGAKSPVEFAGHYTVPSWGCGAGCSMFVVVDSITGTIYDGLLVADLPLDWLEKHEDSLRMEFHPNSRLIKINGCINEEHCGFYDYVMEEGKGLVPIIYVPLRTPYAQRELTSTQPG